MNSFLIGLGVTVYKRTLKMIDFSVDYLTIIPRSKSIAHEAEGRMRYWLRGHEGERNNCCTKIQLVGQQYQNKTTF